MKLILHYLSPHKRKMAASLFLKVVGTFIELLLPLILSHILEKVVVREKISHILFWGGLMVVCALTGAILNMFSNRIVANTARHFSKSLRHDLFCKIMALSPEKIDGFTVPSLEARVTSDTYNLHHFVGMAQRMGVRAPIFLIGGITITMMMDSFLSLIMVAILPFIFVTVYFISRKGVPLYKKVQKAGDQMVKVVREDAGGIRVIKALSKTEHEKTRFDEKNKALSLNDRRAGIIMGAVNPAMTFFMNAGIVAVVAVAASRVANHTSSAETVVAFMQYFTLISNAMMTVTRMFVMYSKASASAGRIGEVLQSDNGLPVESKETYPDKKTENYIEFSDVSFSYEDKKTTVSHIDFGIPKGGTIGIIGATGSGKSTVIRLLLRLYDTTQGAVYIDGENVRTIEKDRLYQKFGTALQQDFLFAGSIRDNIRFERNSTDEEIKKAAEIAQAAEFIDRFPDGYDHMLTVKASNLSGGQKGRILIARALLGNPDILILDDSSSALDYKTDAALRKAIAEHAKSSTVITVAQRVSSVKDCDRILVLDSGNIIGYGTHAELLAGCPAYKEISDSQMGGAILD